MPSPSLSRSVAWRCPRTSAGGVAKFPDKNHRGTYHPKHQTRNITRTQRSTPRKKRKGIKKEKQILPKATFPKQEYCGWTEACTTLRNPAVIRFFKGPPNHTSQVCVCVCVGFLGVPLSGWFKGKRPGKPSILGPHPTPTRFWRAISLLTRLTWKFLASLWKTWLAPRRPIGGASMLV